MKQIIITVISVPLVLFVTAIGLIYSNDVEPVAVSGEEGIDFSSAIATDHEGLIEPSHYQTRSGARLSYRHYAATGDAEMIIILLHGSSWHGMQFHPMAQALVDAGVGDVVLPDLRGHGFDPERRGDVDYIGQMEDDLADLISHLRGEKGLSGSVILGGHSSGGGLAIRFAGGEHGTMADGFVLMAPFIKHDAPTTKPDSGGWTNVALRRIIGLSMLNVSA